VTGVNHDFKVRLRRQDIDEVEYIENGGAYGMDIGGFLVHRHRFFGRVGCVEVPRIRSIEIDSIEDLQLANIVAKHLAAS
jgi:N-acylneuraminate cytidylyltransferase